MAKVMSGRAPWICREAYIGSGQQLRPGHTCGREGLQHVRGIPRPMREYYFDMAFYHQSTVIVDATTFSNKPTTQPEQPLVYANSHVHYGPRLRKPAKTILAEVKLIVHLAIHPFLGVIAGPDIMFTGSNLMLSKAQLTKTQQFENAGVETWCGTSASFQRMLAANNVLRS